MTFAGANGFNPPRDADTPKYTIKAWRGFRGWCIPNIATGELKSTNWDYAWKVGVNTSSHMASGRTFPTHLTGGVTMVTGKVCEYPTTECSCGFYAYHGEHYWWDSGYPTGQGPMMAGVIEGFGRMVVASKGFRAGKAVILALAAPIVVKQQWLDANRMTAEEATVRVRESVQDRYWNVPIYDTIPELLAAHPLRETPKQESA